MMTLRQRPMTAEEAGILRPRLGYRFGERSFVWTHVGGCLAGLVGGSIPASLVAQVDGSWALWTWVGFGLAGIGASHLMYRSSLKDVAAQRAMYLADLEAGSVEEISGSVVGAVVFEEEEDIGPGCLLDFGDGNLLFLQGEQLDDGLDESLFPAERVRISRALETRTVLTFEYEGDPIRVGLPVPLTALKRPLEDGQLLKGRLADFVSLDEHSRNRRNTMISRIVDVTREAPDLIEQAAVLLRDAFLNRSQDWQDLDSAREEVLASIAPDRISRLALDASGKALGWIGGIPTYNGLVWELHPLAVDERHRRQGVGRALVHDLERLVEARGALTLWLGSDDEHDETSVGGVDLYADVPGTIRDLKKLGGEHPAEFYLRLGFRVIGVLPDANGRGKPDIFFAKRVGA